MNKILFAYGSLKYPEVVSALFGRDVENFDATLSSYALYRDDDENIAHEVKHNLRRIGRDTHKYNFIFAKKDKTNSKINGHAYFVNFKEEEILDIWKGYPNWFQKEEVIIKDKNKNNFRAYIYTTDNKGSKLNIFNRVTHDKESLIKQAHRVHLYIKRKYPSLFEES